MPKPIARLFERLIRRLTHNKRDQRHPGKAESGPNRLIKPRPRLFVCRTTLLADLSPRPADGPYSRAAYERWVRAEKRLRPERQRALDGVDTGPLLVHGVVVR